MKEPGENQEIDQFFKKRFEHFTATPSLEDRHKIFNSLEKNGLKKRSVKKYFVAASLLFCVCAFLSIYFLNFHKPKNIAAGTKSGYTVESTADNLSSNSIKNEPKEIISNRSITNKGDSLIAKKGKERSTDNNKKVHTDIESIYAGAHEKNILLPDSSLITLQANSRISYSKNSHFKRSVELDGFAVFSISKKSGQNFTVVSGNSVVEVLGTTFHVHATETAIMEVSVVEGRVMFYQINNKVQKIELVAGESAFLNNQGIPEKSPFATTLKAIEQKELKFNNAPFSKVIKELEGAFAVEIEVADKEIIHCTYSGTFPNPKNIEEVLDVITGTLGFTYAHQNGKIEIFGNKCK